MQLFKKSLPCVCYLFLFVNKLKIHYESALWASSISNLFFRPSTMCLSSVWISKKLRHERRCLGQMAAGSVRFVSLKEPSDDRPALKMLRTMLKSDKEFSVICVHFVFIREKKAYCLLIFVNKQTTEQQNTVIWINIISSIFVFFFPSFLPSLSLSLPHSQTCLPSSPFATHPLTNTYTLTNMHTLTNTCTISHMHTLTVRYLGRGAW